MMDLGILSDGITGALSNTQVQGFSSDKSLARPNTGSEA